MRSFFCFCVCLLALRSSAQYVWSYQFMVVNESSNNVVVPWNVFVAIGGNPFLYAQGSNALAGCGYALLQVSGTSGAPSEGAQIVADAPGSNPLGSTAYVLAWGSGGNCSAGGSSLWWTNLPVYVGPGYVTNRTTYQVIRVRSRDGKSFRPFLYRKESVQYVPNN